MSKTKNQVTISKFLSAFFTDEYESISLITLPSKGVGEKPSYCKTTISKFSKDIVLQKQLLKENKIKGIYFFVNSGGTRNKEIKKYNAFFIENDKLSIDNQHKLLDRSPIQPSIRVETKKSVHAYWLIEGDCSEAEWKEMQIRLITFFNSDKSIKNPARCMRLPYFNHVSYDGKSLQYKKVELHTFNPEKRFTVEEMKQNFLSLNADEPVSKVKDTIECELNSLNSYHRTKQFKIPAKETAVAAKPNSLNSLQFYQEFPKETVLEAVNINFGSLQERKCFYGLAGEIVKTIEPHTEADSMALLLNTLISFGNAIGRKSYFEADGAKHYTNLFGVLVGSTSAGKGTSWSQINKLFASVDKEWCRNRVQGGLSSGEGLICAVKDGDTSTDKRLLVVESEFSSVLSMNKRDGNTLSPIIRGFWDEGSAQTMTKNDPVSVNDAHISIIGHITPDELRARLNQTEIANGFVNRFLWLDVKRSKSLPEGGNVSDEATSTLVKKLSEAIEFAQTVEKMERDEESRLLWIKKYPELTAERTGAFGNATARARAQVVRISVIYALMDKSNVVKREHLGAALDFWNYCENSARKIFGDNSGNKLADEICNHLKSAKNGLSRTDIHKLTQKNYSSKQIDDALLILTANGLAYSQDEKHDASSRYTEFWYFYEFNEFFNNVSDNLGIAI